MSISVFSIIAIVVVFAAFVQGATGVGFALIVAPVLALTKPELLPGGLLLLMMPLNIFIGWRERAAFEWRGSAWVTAGRVGGTFVGLWVLIAVAPSTLSMLVGVATLLAALASMLVPAFDPTPSAFAVAGVVTGITETATGIGGPPLALVYQHHSPAGQRANMAVCLLLGQVMSLTLLAVAGRLSWTQVGLAAVFLPGLAIGGFCSRFAHAGLEERRLRIFVLGFAIVSGIVLIARA